MYSLKLKLPDEKDQHHELDSKIRRILEKHRFESGCGFGDNGLNVSCFRAIGELERGVVVLTTTGNYEKHRTKPREGSISLIGFDEQSQEYKEIKKNLAVMLKPYIIPKFLFF